MASPEQTVDLRHEIERLVEFEGRRPGSDAERRAARHLARRLEELGRQAKVEPVDTWPRWAVAWALHALLAIVGSVLAVSSAIAGAALAFAAALLTFVDAAGLPPLTRRLLGRRASQNVVSREDGGKAGTLVLVAHYDAGQGGAPFSRRLEERRATVGRLLRRPIGRLEPVFWAILAVLVCCLLRLPGLEGTALTAVQFVPTVVLIVAAPLLVDIALSRVSPGANDNASGVTLALRLGTRHAGRLEHFDLWVLLTGAQESLSDGMRGFIRRARLDKRQTVFVNLDEVGAGTVRYTRREGLVVAARSHRQLVDLCEEIAEDDEDGSAFGARGLVSRSASDGATARAAGFPAITITCRNALDYTPDHHQPTDTPERIEDAALRRAEAFTGELIERLDAQLGPELERGGVSERE